LVSHFCHSFAISLPLKHKYTEVELAPDKKLRGVIMQSALLKFQPKTTIQLITAAASALGLMLCANSAFACANNQNRAENFLADSGFDNLGCNLTYARPDDVLIVISNPGSSKAAITHSGIAGKTNNTGKLIINGPFSDHSKALQLTEDQFRCAFLSKGERLQVWRKKKAVQQFARLPRTERTIASEYFSSH
jgi:hypothetical protein